MIVSKERVHARNPCRLIGLISMLLEQLDVVESMPIRISAVSKLKGSSTKC